MEEEGRHRREVKMVASKEDLILVSIPVACRSFKAISGRRVGEHRQASKDRCNSNGAVASGIAMDSNSSSVLLGAATQRCRWYDAG